MKSAKKHSFVERRETRLDPEEGRKILVRDWELSDIFSSLTVKDLTISASEHSNWKQHFWDQICTEYDSKNFFQYLLSFSQRWSPSFIEFVFYWLRDEQKHALGFAKLYSLIYAQSVESILNEVANRPVSFKSIEHLLKDEFQMCLTLAYDEIVTTHSYHRSISFYENINKPYLGKWIRHLKSDESIHFSNLLFVMKQEHGDRLKDARAILEDILEFDKTSKEPYGSTFVLDHGVPDFAGSMTDEELETKCVLPIIQKLETHTLRLVQNK